MRPNRKEILHHLMPGADDFTLDRLDEAAAQEDSRLKQLQQTLTESEFNELLLGRAASALARADLVPEKMTPQGMQIITTLYARRLRICLEEYL